MSEPYRKIEVLQGLADALQQYGGPLRAEAIRGLVEEQRTSAV
jgi:hypothetical protein